MCKGVKLLYLTMKHSSLTFDLKINNSMYFANFFILHFNAKILLKISLDLD